MKSVIVIVAMMLAGCTQTKIKTPTWSMERVMFSQQYSDGRLRAEGPKHKQGGER